MPRHALEMLADSAEARAAEAAVRLGTPQTWGPGAASRIRQTLAEAELPGADLHYLGWCLFDDLRRMDATLAFSADAQRAVCPCSLCHPPSA